MEPSHDRVDTLHTDTVHTDSTIADADPRDAVIAELRQKVMDLELALLHSRDFAIGAIAETGELRLANAESMIHAENQRAHISRLEQHVAQLDKQLRRRTKRMKELERLVASRTYKVGRLVMLPVRILKRLAR